MNFIYFGTLFVVVGFSVNIGGGQVELFPDAIGYFLILKGTQSLLELQPNFKKLQPFLYFLLGYNALVFIDKLFNIIPNSGYIYFVFGSIALVLYFLVFYRLFKDFDGLKIKLRRPEEVDRLNRSWLRYTYACIIFLVLSVLEIVYFITTLGFAALQTLFTYFLNYSTTLEATVTELLNSNQIVITSVFIYILIAIVIVLTILVYLFKVIYSLYKINNDFRTAQ
ncbi:MAG TPA: hypothetical protein VFH18_01100 [Erysipelotrichaceae bacterium]|nr:hypothetical protein [Erysipelotrichaceae bacterium]